MKNVMRGILVSSLLWSCGVDREKVDVINGKDGHSMASFVADIPAGILCASGGRSLDIYVDMDDSSSVSDGDKYSSSLVSCNGLNGLAGIDGLPGTTGEQGATGAQGVPGATGPRGLQGEMGGHGNNGKDGKDGKDGHNGQDGQNGHDGSSDCSDLALSDCRNGAQGPAGAPGAQGPAGTPGAQGPAGPAGPAGATGPAGGSGSSVTITVYSSSTCTLVVGSSPSFYAKSGSLYTTSTCASSSRVALQVGESVWIGARILITYDGSGLRAINFN